MNTIPPTDVTQLLIQMGHGDPDAPAKVVPLVYDGLRRLARGYFAAGAAGPYSATTAVVHEAYLRLVQEKDIDWENRSHFFAIAARVMRQILVNYAKAHRREKRGGGAHKLSLEAAEFVPQGSADDLLTLDELLQHLAKTYPRQSEVVELKFFGGMETKEIAAALRISEKTVLRDWNFARLWLFASCR